MWLEEFAWLWVPIVSGVGLWGLWSLVTVKAEVQALRGRVARLENGDSVRRDTSRQVA